MTEHKRAPITNQQAILDAAEEYARVELAGDGGGHDWWHVHRVRNLAVRIAAEEGADAFIVELAAILHDIGDYKLSGSLTAGRDAAYAFAVQHQLGADTADLLAEIVHGISFKGLGVQDNPLSLEGYCVRDADRLDALGAIGVGRTFAYGGKVGRPMWDPEREPEVHQDEAAYRNATGSSIDHFHEKLLHLRKRISTSAGKRIAKERHAFIETFLREFTDEWDGVA